MGMGTYNGRAMLSAFGQECGGQRMMRGEQLWRTDKVIDKSTAVTAHGFTISAKVLSQDYRSGAPGGAYTTSLRFVPMSVAETNVAHGLVVKAELWPRAVAHYHSVGFLAGVGTNHAIAQNLIESVTNVAIIPTAWTQAATASCTCGDFGPGAWCKHVAALGYEDQSMRGGRLLPIQAPVLRAVADAAAGVAQARAPGDRRGDLPRQRRGRGSRGQRGETARRVRLGALGPARVAHRRCSMHA